MFETTKQKKYYLPVVFILFFSFITIPVLFLNASGEISSATTYLKNKNPNPWITMALVAANENVNVDYLKNVSGDKAIDYEAPILALIAAGKNPKTFPNTDFISKLKSFHAERQLGDPELLNDDIFGVLALISSGEDKSSALITDSKNFILASQKTDGSFPYSKSSERGDTNTTAMAITALIESGTSPNNDSILKARNYLKNSQNDDGGFPYDPASPWGHDSDASSDSWVINAIYKIGENPVSWTKNGNTPLSHLSSLQNQSGFYSYVKNAAEDSFSPTTTAYALLAILGKTYPITPQLLGLPHVSYRIEGSSSTVCAGESDASTPLKLIETVNEECGLTYRVKETSFGPYLETINNDTAAGSSGWLYTVNQKSPSEILVGAGDYKLNNGDSVLWYFGSWELNLTRLTASSANLSAPGPVTLKAESLKNGSWQPLSGAVIKLKKSSDIYTADENGETVLSLAGGFYEFYAEKTGQIRSDVQKITVGGSEVLSLPLSVTVDGTTQNQPGNSGGLSEISLLVEGDISDKSGAKSLDFGSVAKGKKIEKNVSLKNIGSVPISVESVVSGDDIFRNYLKLDNGSWRNFQANLDNASSKNIQISLTIPSAYDKPGLKQGTLIFWAVKNQ